MAVNQQGHGEHPDPADVRRLLDSIIASEPFRASPQLGVFLRFIVEATLRGESSRIKGYTIGVEAFGRPESFDPQIDPIVRVEATRLRRTLERYYAGPGIADPIVIEISRGSYVPTLRLRHAAGKSPPSMNGFAGLRERLATVHVPRWSIAALATAVALIAALSAFYVFETRGRPAAVAGADAPGRSFDGPLQPGNGMPTLAIAKINVLSLPPAPGAPRSYLGPARPLREKLRVAIAAFDTVNVAGDLTDETDAPGAAAGTSRHEASADYELVTSGEFQQDGSVIVRFRLLDVAENAVVWSRTFGPFGPTLNYGPVEDSVVKELVMTLLPPFGVVRANERRKHIATGAGDPRYRCVVEASESFRSFDPAQHRRARACLESLTARDPTFALGFAYLAAVYTREFSYGLGAEPDNPTVMDKALQAARQAIELNPESARAYQMLFTVLFARHDMTAAFAAGDKAIALNPNDMTILSDYGGRLIITGEVDRGMEMLLRAADASAVRPSWYQFYLFLGSYLKNDLATASSHASQIVTSTYPLGMLAHALVAAADGNPEEARRDYEQLVALREGWRDRPREELGRHFPSPSIVDRLMRDLINGGVLPARPH